MVFFFVGDGPMGIVRATLVVVIFDKKNNHHYRGISLLLLMFLSLRHTVGRQTVI